MKFLARIHGSEGLKVIVGSGFFWAWLDALFMSAFFLEPESSGFMPEAATMAAFGFNIPFLTLAACKCSLVERAISNKQTIVALGLVGSIGSIAYLYAGISSNWIALLAGGVCCGLFLAFAATAWGATYCHAGARWATPFIAGGFACAALIDALFLCMIPYAAAVFYAALPLMTGVFFILVNPKIRTYPASQSNSKIKGRGVRYLLWRYLGISIIILVSMMLVKIGFGYLQHIISFSPDVSGERLGGTGVQLARGAAALVIFLFLVLRPRISSPLYRVGFLTMIAGIMLMPLAIGTPFFAVSEAAIIGGYTVFDVFLWVAFSHIAYSQSKAPIKTIVVMRLISAVCYVVGASIGIFATGFIGNVDFAILQKTTVVGYFMVIATVLLLSSEDARLLFRSTQTPSSLDSANNSEARTEQWLESIGLTAREKEIAALIMQGRTQPWISESLSISRNTVGTHMRHIYQKAEVHDRQQFIDEALLHASHSLRDTSDEIT